MSTGEPTLLSPGSCIARALYPFQSAESSSLDFRPGDIINVLSKLDSGWWLGSVVNRGGGGGGGGGGENNNDHSTPQWFPKDYVEVIISDDSVSQMNSLNINTILASPAKVDRNDEIVLKHMQRSETYDKQQHFNPRTGETGMSMTDALLLDEEDPFPTHRDERSWIRDDGDGHDDYEENTFHAEKLPLPWVKYIAPQGYMELFPEAVEADTIDSRNASLTWETLSSCIAITIHNLDSAIQYSKKHLYHPYTLATVNVVRFMLVTTGCTDKNQFPKPLQAPHRALIAILARLRLSTLFLEKVRDNDMMKDWTDVVDKQTLATSARELLVAVRTFVTACQAVPIQIVRPEPRFSSSGGGPAPSAATRINMSSSITTIPEEDGGGTQDDDDDIEHSFSQTSRKMQSIFSLAGGPLVSGSGGTRALRASSTSTHLTASTIRSNSTSGTSVASSTGTGDEMDLNVIRTYGQSLQRSVDTMLVILETFEWQEQQQLTALTGLLFTRLDHLSTRTSQLVLSIESIYFGKEKEVQMSLSKQALLDGFGQIFCNLQLATGDHAQIDALIIKIKASVEGIKMPIASMLDCIESVVISRAAEEEKYDGGTAAAMIESGNNISNPEASSDSSLPPKRLAEKWYMGHDYSEETLQLTSDGHVKSGTLEALVERLTPHDQLDMNFIRTFLLTYRSFCKARELFELLEARFNQPAPDGLIAADFEDWRERKQKVIRLRVFNVLKMWIEYYFSMEEDLDLLDDMLDFVNATPEFFAKKPLERVIQKLQSDSDDPLRKLVSMPRDAPEPTLPRSMTRFRLLDIPPLELARQMAIMNFDLYRSIKPSECLNKGWSGAAVDDEDDGSRSSPNVRKTIEYNNQVTLWVCCTILSSQDAKKRSDVLKYWIQVADKCNELNNFNTCMAILSAFDSSSIGRLRRTWDGIGQRHVTSLAALRSLFSPNRNFIEYRTHVHSINPPCIPFLGIYLQDLTFIEDGNPNVVKNENQKEHINFSKLDKTGRVIRELQQFQNVAYSLQSVEPLQHFVTTQLQSTRDEEKIYRDSLAIEPKEREDQKVTRMLEESGFV